MDGYETQSQRQNLGVRTQRDVLEKVTRAVVCYVDSVPLEDMTRAFMSALEMTRECRGSRWLHEATCFSLTDL